MRKLFAIVFLSILCALPGRVFAVDASSTGLSTTGTAAFGSAAVSGENATISYFVGAYILKPVFGLVGVGFFVLTVYAGVLWMTAAGDSKKVDKAKDILTASVIGLVIIISSYVLTNALFTAITTGSAA